MNKNQKINCHVESCIYQDPEQSKCSLEEIVVQPCDGCSTGEADESMCGSYECYKEGNYDDE